MTPIRIALIADDLTGALDAAAPFVAEGMAAVVATSLRGLPRAIAAGCPVVAVSLGSREVTADKAAGMARMAARHLAGAEWMFKKIDSRLKGHVAAEVQAVAAQRGAAEVILCPAIPAMGRIVVRGKVTGFGVGTPIDVRVTAIAMAAGLGGLAVQVPDAATDADLDAMVAAVGPDVVLCGARGLAAALARKLSQGAVAAVSPLLPQPVGIAVGSRDPITLAQVAALRADHPGLNWTPAPDGQAAAFTGAGNTLLQAVPGGGGADGATVSQRLAAAFVRDHVPGRRALILTGGETATAVLAGMGVAVLQLLGEVAEGLPLSRPLDLSGSPLIVTKSGGFGAADALSRLVPGGPDTRQDQ